MSSCSRRRGVIQVQGTGHHAVSDLQQGWRSGRRGPKWIPNNVRLCIGKAGRDEYQRASRKRVQLWKETVRLEVTPLFFGKWGLRHRKHRGWGRFGSEEPHWARLRAVKETGQERQGPSVVAFNAGLRSLDFHFQAWRLPNKKVTDHTVHFVSSKPVLNVDKMAPGGESERE